MDNFKEEMAVINTPQFPGQQFGASIEQVRSMIKRQKRLKGYNFTVPTNASEFDIKISGTARILLGIALLPNQKNASSFLSVTQVQFKVNNEIIIDQLDPNFLTQLLNNNEYYYIPRPLSGQDDITISFLNTGGDNEDVRMVLYYI
jgi:hypothetical protein